MRSKQQQQLQYELGTLLCNLKDKLTPEIATNFKVIMFNLNIGFDHLIPGFIGKLAKDGIPLEDVDSIVDYVRWILTEQY